MNIYLYRLWETKGDATSVAKYDLQEQGKGEGEKGRGGGVEFMSKIAYARTKRQ